MQKNYLQIDPRDNVIVAITNLEKGLSTKIGKQSGCVQKLTAAEHLVTNFCVRRFTIAFSSTILCV